MRRRCVHGTSGAGPAGHDVLFARHGPQLLYADRRLLERAGAGEVAEALVWRARRGLRRSAWFSGAAAVLGLGELLLLGMPTGFLWLAIALFHPCLALCEYRRTRATRERVAGLAGGTQGEAGS